MECLHDIDHKLNKLLENRNRSLSGLFKAIRSDKRIEHIGDYPIVCYICALANKKWTRLQMTRALKLTDFYVRGTPKGLQQYMK